MPTYEYECQKCGHRFEEFQSMKDAPLTKCPECKGKVKRLIGAGAGFLFKGSGFYITDYRSSSYSDKKKKEGSDAAASPMSPPSAADKPAARSADKPAAKPAEKPKKSPGKKGKD
jgi:putative FmdB family regulatory protein